MLVAAETVKLTTINCGECGGTYALNTRYVNQKQTNGGYWNCPYCKCSWGYGDQSENARLKKELELERKRKEWAQKDAERAKEQRDAAQYRERAQKAAKTRIKNRIAKGVCPCCNRTFSDLSRHMSTKHPEYAKSE